MEERRREEEQRRREEEERERLAEERMRQAYETQRIGNVTFLKIWQFSEFWNSFDLASLSWFFFFHGLIWYQNRREAAKWSNTFRHRTLPQVGPYKNTEKTRKTKNSEPQTPEKQKIEITKKTTKI